MKWIPLDGNPITVIRTLKLGQRDGEDIVMGGNTMTAAALEHALTHINEGGAYDRSADEHYAKNIILVTDGEPDDKPCEVVSKLTDAGINLFVVGIDRDGQEFNFDNQCAELDPKNPETG